MTPDVEVRPESGLWKDSLDSGAVKKLAEQIGRAYTKFDQSGFTKTVLSKSFFTLELKERINRIAEVLKEYLPQKYTTAINVIIKTAPTAGTFENWAMLTYIEKFGLDNFKDSIHAMEVLTPFSTAEFAIRPFMIRYTDEILPILHRWSKDNNEHIRRLAAEASRPRGVWVAHIERFKKDPTDVMKLLENLKADESLYVRKAVANNLNDISKDHPDIVITTGKRWLKSTSKETDWIVKHACRTLLKKGYPPVFPLFGFTENPSITIDELKLNKKRIRIGDTAELSFTLHSKSSESQKLVVDYVVHYMKKNGRQAPKVFKLSEKVLKPKEQIYLKTKHSFAEMSTRKHNPGKHSVEIMINGKKYQQIEFSLV